MSLDPQASQRLKIGQAFAERLEGRYGPSGQINQAMRKVLNGVWMPGSAVRPQATVTDGGQKRAGYDDSETEKSMALLLQVVIDLTADWVSDYATWLVLIEDMITSTQNWLPPGMGCLRMEYEDDDPVTVVLADAATEEIWILNFRCTYFCPVGEIGKE
jgi:hypothetical protein